MRPVALELEGFGAFRDRTLVDFDGLDLVALVGPTGSGKSTVIDAITFALYGSVARYDNTSLVAPVIHQLANEARVRFDFELAGRRYIAVRVVRRAKPTPSGTPRASTKEARLELVEADGSTTVLAGSVSELDTEIGRLIGLDFHQFTRTIVLPQGDFAEFLTDDPGNRQKLLRRLLDLDIYARMGAKARDRAKDAAQRIEIHAEELERLATIDQRRLDEARERVTVLATFAEGLDERLVRIAEVEAELTARRDDVTELDRSIALLGAIAVPDGLRTADAVTSQALQALEQARTALTDTQQRRDGAVAALDGAGDPNLLRRLLTERRQIDELERTVLALDAEHTEVEAEVTAHLEARDEAATAAADRAEQLRSARRAADAAHWRAQLVAGETCPVCDQVVNAVPEAAQEGALVALGQASTTADAALDAAGRALARVEGRVQALAADRDQQRKRLDALRADHDDDPTVTPEALDAAEAAAVEAETAAQALRHAETTLRGAQSELEAARRAESGFRSNFMVQRDGVVALGAPPPSGESLVDDWDELAAWAGAEALARSERRSSVAAAGKELAATKATELERLAEAAATVELSGDPALVKSALAAARATADAEVDRLVADLARADDLRSRIDELSTRQTVYESLGRQHLAAGGFERWLLAEALDHLVAEATTRLLELSGGRYSLEAVDGSFAVRDHANADERRDIRTLSGGEIFLASLSLALALSSSIAELASDDGPRLESIFLDEGFGTLDVETLDTLAAAIEELSASGRLVAIVTHVRELAERMPVRFEVHKGATTSTIARVEG